MSSAAPEVEAASCWSLVEVPITAFGNRHGPATTQPVITQMIPLREWSHTPIGERRCLECTVDQANTVFFFLVELVQSG